MDCKEIVRIGLDECLDGLRKALADLTADERRFQPSPDANHIDFIVWHMARDEDDAVQGTARHTTQVWQRDAWDEKLGLPAGDDGFGYTIEQVANLPQFNITDCLAYYAAVRHETLRYLDTLTAEDLDRCPEPARHSGYTLGRLLSHLIVELSQHLGQVAYIRGLQRGLEFTTSWPSARTPWPSPGMQG